MIVKGKTDIGVKRHTNQDAFVFKTLADSSVLAVVCDGMGGANAGNIASNKAVEVIASFFERSYRSGINADEAIALLQSAIISANIEIYDMAAKDSALSGMGTTVVAAFVDGNTAVISHVGDSRAYIVGSGITQLTRDHSVVQSLIESGKLTPNEARVHPKKNVITRALGIEPDVLVDSNQFEISAGETVLLCTDGLSNFIEPAEIKDIFNRHSPENTAELLVECANSNGGGDNITVVTITL